MNFIFFAVGRINLCNDVLIEVAEAPTSRPAAFIGASIAAASVIERPKAVAIDPTSGRASARSWRVRAVTFSIALNIAS